MIDLRYAYVTCCADNVSYCSPFPQVSTSTSSAWPTPNVTDQNVLWTTSSISGQYVMFTTEALYYAQSGYFVTIVMIQWSNVFACKSRKVPLSLS